MDTLDSTIQTVSFQPVRDLHPLELRPTGRTIGIAVKTAINMAIPHLNVGANVVGPLWANSSDPCVFCSYENSLLRNRFEENPHPHPSLLKRQFAPLISQTCATAVVEACYYLTGAFYPSSRSAIITQNFLSPEKNSREFLKKTDSCTFCGGEKS